MTDLDGPAFGWVILIVVVMIPGVPFGIIWALSTLGMSIEQGPWEWLAVWTLIVCFEFINWLTTPE